MALEITPVLYHVPDPQVYKWGFVVGFQLSKKELDVILTEVLYPNYTHSGIFVFYNTANCFLTYLDVKPNIKQQKNSYVSLHLVHSDFFRV